MAVSMNERCVIAVTIVCVLSIPPVAESRQAARGRAGRSAATATATLKDPSRLTETAPDVFRARFETSAGVFVIEARRAWAPIGADRFYNLVKNGFYDNARFFRVLDGFMVQFGLKGDPDTQAAWRPASLPDEPAT